MAAGKNNEIRSFSVRVDLFLKKKKRREMASIENRVGILPSIDPTDSANFSFLLIRLSLQQEMIVRQLNVTTVNKKRSNCCEMKEIFPNFGFVTERIEEELR